MIRFNKIILFILTAILMAWLLPWTYHFLTSRPASYPFTLYSCITHSFASIQNKDGQKIYTDHLGQHYSERQFDSILPTFYYRQLMADSRLPQNIEGIPVEIKDLSRENFMFRNTTPRIKVITPPLYPLLEAMPKRINLEMPEDVFRINHRMEFIDMATNQVKENKSEQFSTLMKNKGFEFPAHCIAGNPTTRKDYDEGYLITDQNDQLFHIKQLRNRPFVRNTQIPTEIKPKYIFPTEYPGRHFYCFLTDQENRFYALQTQTYELKQIPVGTFNPEKENITIFGNAFYWTIQIMDQTGKNRLYAVNPRDYSLKDTLTLYPEWQGESYEKIAAYLFPFELSFTSSADKLAFPRITDFSGHALFLNLFLAISYFVCNRKKFPDSLKNVLLLCCLGIFGIIPLIIQKYL